MEKRWYEICKAKGIPEEKVAKRRRKNEALLALQPLFVS